ncbi:ketoacyl-ACP synthase III [Shouchella hunanensis]|uniref:Ketoacyl-ACP synthase III n=1 Tax=Shouchella hunanensis TaxID=766894 RepID=A0ABY7W369_9BACI|nr:ketoacyl-ACP synthase III [Shouchella hunanensis]WDF02039.1 ketoacyl-ACP synthase III [Shouchella hunanensis]
MTEILKIASIGTYLPSKRVDNKAKAEKYGYAKTFVDRKLGFKSIAKKTKEETVIEMCLKAYDNLTKKQEFNEKEIELVTVVTQSKSVSIPHASAIIHNELKLNKQCMTFDISQGCSGYVHALSIVKSVMQSLNFQNALIFTCDPYSEIIDDNDPNVSMIFGDGATVSLINSKESGFFMKDFKFGTVPESNECLINKDGFFRMDGRRVFNYAIQEIPQSVNQLLDKNHVAKDEVDLFLFHQGSKYIVDSLTKQLEVNQDLVIFNSDNYGNTVSSSIPLLLSRYLDSLEIKTVILSGFGVGFTWGTCILSK